MLALAGIMAAFASVPRGAHAASAEARDKTGARLAVGTTPDGIFAALCPKGQKEECKPESGVRINPPVRARAGLDAARVRVVPLAEGRGLVEVLIGDAATRAYLVLIAAGQDEPRVVTSGWVGASEDRRYATKTAGKSESITIETWARHCGSTVLVGRERLDPRTLALVAEQTAESATTTAVVVDAVAGERTGKLDVLAVDGATSAEAGYAVDGKLDTSWYRRAEATGERVLLSAPRELEVKGLDVTIGKPGLLDDFVPTVLLVRTERDAYRVKLPDAVREGGTFGFSFPQTKTARCLSVEVERATPATKDPKPPRTGRLGIAEITARTALDGETLDSLAGGLGNDPAAVEKRTRVLVGLGEAGLAALAARYRTLDASTRDGVRRVVDSMGCDVKLAVYVPLLDSTDRDEESRARDRIRRCGKDAFNALMLQFAAAKGEARARFAEEASLLDPARAVPILVNALTRTESAAERRMLRKALAKAAGRDASVPAFETLFGGTAFAELSTKSKVEVFRASSGRLADVKSARVALAGTLAAATGFRERYLLLPAIAEVARASDPTSLKLLGDLLADQNPHLRARAVEVSRGVAPLGTALLARTRDPEPRVREAAMRSVDGARLSVSDLRSLTATLRPEPWTFVKRAGVGLTVVGPRDATVDDALGELVEWTDAPEVRADALTALGARRGTTQLARIASRARDDRELLPVRLRAVDALGKLCIDEAVDPLSDLVEKGSDSALEADLKVAALAIHALAALAPANLGEHLAPALDAEAPVDLRNLARQALAPPKPGQPARVRCR